LLVTATSATGIASGLLLGMSLRSVNFY
jgi:hypothetical protein